MGETVYEEACSVWSVRLVLGSHVVQLCCCRTFTLLADVVRSLSHRTRRLYDTLAGAGLLLTAWEGTATWEAEEVMRLQVCIRVCIRAEYQPSVHGTSAVAGVG